MENLEKRLGAETSSEPEASVEESKKEEGEDILKEAGIERVTGKGEKGKTMEDFEERKKEQEEKWKEAHPEEED